jgi:hypothetical protein
MPEVIQKGKQPLGDIFTQQLSGRAYGGILADTTALGAIKVVNRQHGMLAVVSPAALWVFDQTSVASAGASVIVPAAGSGRWLKTT